MMFVDGDKEITADDIRKICSIIGSITKLDVRLLDDKGDPVFQLVNHIIPNVISCEDDWTRISYTLMKGAPGNYCYRINAYILEFVACGVWKCNDFAGSVVAGPFISSIPDADFVSGVICSNSIPISERKPLKDFYESLTISGMNYANDIAALMVNLCSHPYVVPRLAADIDNPAAGIRRDLKTDTGGTKNVINLRYAFEKDMMNAIAKGDKAGAEQLLDESDSLMNFPERAESSIRSLKNISFVLNTLCRIAAKRGGVQPVYLHNISEKFAIMIERAPNLPKLKELSHIMVQEYCDLVRNVSSSGYSALVKKTSDYIDLNIDRQLTVKDIADEVHANPSHLSRKFKNDTGMTIVDYINMRRTEEAKIYLESGNASVTEVALMVGYNDLNYFGRVFKKITGMTPSRYMKTREAEKK